MATLQGIKSGFTPPSPMQPKKSKSVIGITCDCCGFNFQGTQFQSNKRFVEIDDGVRVCKGCFTFFDMGGFDMYRISSPETYQESKEKLGRIRKDKYVIMLKTQNFSGIKTGMSFAVEFGDIFLATRVGSFSEPDGTSKTCKDLHTIDIQVGQEVLTLFTHEVGVVSWLDIMQFRKDGDYIESYLSPDDLNGYFTPTDECREALKNMFGVE